MIKVERAGYVALSKHSSKMVIGTYRVVAESTAQAIKVAEEYRRDGWRCTTRGRRIVMTTHRDASLRPDTPVVLWQMDRSPHEEACKQWLVPELRGRRKKEDEDDVRDAGDEDADNKEP